MNINKEYIKTDIDEESIMAEEPRLCNGRKCKYKKYEKRFKKVRRRNRLAEDIETDLLNRAMPN